MLDWKTLTIFTHSSLLVIAESRRHWMRGRGRCGLFIEAFTQSLCSWNVLALSNKQNAQFSLLYSFKQQIKYCTASVNFPFQNHVKVCVSCLHGFWNKVCWLVLIANSQLYSRLPHHSWWTLFNYFAYSSHQYTPLHNAAHKGHMHIVRYLVEQGADINIKDKNGVSEWE